MAVLGDFGRRWRTALYVIVMAFFLAVPGMIVAPTARAAAAATATLSVTSTWQTGFIASFTVTNMSAAPLSDWKLEFDMPVGQSVSHAWSSKVTQSGTHFVVTPVNWNRIIAPGASATGGFRGVLSGSYSPPSNCMLNRQVLCS
ncbi:cellulose binding domain-containing protein [Mycobacterium koreense]|uniref:CBM2 domain-containing protein n=1 Tax=Mycolicibacillus koreensis TaxID=1069220 RepID=A0AA91PGZ8_9MYCO|nr:cellulose binding domain-containing protein [Mycolicibacillus koreensis]OSC35100.1 hypothetical protein B8W67_04570 [Mycolicibacillus koreensis]